MGDDIPELIDFKKQFAEYVYMLAIYYSLKVVFINTNYCVLYRTSRSETFKEGSQYSGSSQISHVDRFMYKTVVKSVSEIITVLEVVLMFVNFF